jgi:NitT/TauT family transport system substrate-binding protein
MVILGKTKIKDALDAHPELKELLLSFSPRFEKLNNKLIFNTVGRWATFNDVARMGDLSVCVILHKLNEAIGSVAELERVFPECINVVPPPPEMEKPGWVDSVRQLVVMDVRSREDFFFTDIMRQLGTLKPENALKVVNSFYPAPLIGMLKEEGYEFFVETLSPEEVNLFVQYRAEDEDPDKTWRERKESFEIFDVRKSTEDPFGAIIKKAQDTPPGEGFKLVQRFEPVPLNNMLIPLDIEYETVKIDFFEYHIYFYKKVSVPEESRVSAGEKIPVVIQAATPVVLPIVLHLLKSKKLMNLIQIQELKVWRETEKHMAWIVNGRADITFSAVAAAAKLYLTGNDIRMASIDIWDNFYVLTRGYEAKSFADLKGHDFHIPLYREAPPYAVTDYLMKQTGENPEEYNFVFGNPFGRPEEMQRKLVKGEIDTVLLREPEASFAIHAGKGEIREAFSYSDIWQTLTNTSGQLPNAGLILKGDLVKKHPEIVKVFYEELEETIRWINENPHEAAEQSYDLMGGSVEALELFLKRVTFKHEKAGDRIVEILDYLKVLGSNKPFSYVGDNEEVRGMFELE